MGNTEQLDQAPQPTRFTSRNDSGVVSAVPDSIQGWVDRYLPLVVGGRAGP